MLEDPKIKRLKELSKIEYPSDQDYEELEKLKEDLGLSNEEHEAIKPIQDYRKLASKRQAQQEELRSLTAKRKELQTILDIRKEKERLERIKNQLDGKIYCDDCKKWVYPSHFD